MTERKYPSEVQIFLFENGEINVHPVFENWEWMNDYYFELPVEEKLAFDDALDRIAKQYRKKLEKIERDELGRRILLITDAEKYFK